MLDSATLIASRLARRISGRFNPRNIVACHVQRYASCFGSLHVILLLYRFILRTSIIAFRVNSRSAKHGYSRKETARFQALIVSLRPSNALITRIYPAQNVIWQTRRRFESRGSACVATRLNSINMLASCIRGRQVETSLLSWKTLPNLKKLGIQVTLSHNFG